MMEYWRWIRRWIQEENDELLYVDQALPDEALPDEALPETHEAGDDVVPAPEEEPEAP